MGNINEKWDRNKQIFNERVDGAQVIELSKKYNLSLPRIHRICMKEENKVLKLENAKLRSELDMLSRPSGKK
jgi:Mor family transcriptional regulator